MSEQAPPEGFRERADVVVVGGGIAGSSVLHHLGRAGIDALLLEKGRVGGGATEAAVGVLSPPLRQPFHETEHDRGTDRARAIWDFALRSIRGLAEALEAAGATSAAELDLSGGYTLAESSTEHAVRSSFEALASAGFPVQWLDGEAVRALTGGRGFTGGYLLEGGGSLNPGATARALAESGRSAGCGVAEGVAVKAVERDPDGLICVTDHGPVRTSMVVYATHVDSRRFSSLLGYEIVPIRGQGMAVRTEGLAEMPGSFATHWKLNVWRQGGDGTLYLGGWRHDAWDRAYWKSRPELDDGLQGDLEGWFRHAFPEARLEVERRWSGIFGWTSDYLPLVGPLPGSPDEMVVSGFSGGGLPFAFECGRILAAAIAGDTPVEGAHLFNPHRFI